jgi:hypothetical protein
MALNSTNTMTATTVLVPGSLTLSENFLLSPPTVSEEALVVCCTLTVVVTVTAVDGGVPAVCSSPPAAGVADGCAALLVGGRDGTIMLTVTLDTGQYTTSVSTVNRVEYM